MRVRLLYHTPLSIAAHAGRTCTGNEADAYEEEENVELFLSKIIKKGHESVLEHITYTFRIEGISRALLQELARHRHISLSVLSTRYTLSRDIAKSIENASEFVDDMSESLSYDFMCAYWDYVAELRREISNSSPRNDIIKYFIPECFLTNVVMTLNARELRHIIKLRSAPGALREFRELCATFLFRFPEDHRFMYEDVYRQGGE